MLVQLLAISSLAIPLNVTRNTTRRTQVLLAGGPTGTACCGGGGSCGHAECPLQATNQNGCMAVYEIDHQRPCFVTPAATIVPTGPPAATIVPTGPPAATTDPPARCDVGFCESPNDCLRCASGQRCVQSNHEVCAGTCFGTCQSITASPCTLTDSHGNCVPEHCDQWFDGCNQCRRRGTMLLCTRMTCLSLQPATCVASGQH